MTGPRLPLASPLGLRVLVTEVHRVKHPLEPPERVTARVLSARKSRQHLLTTSCPREPEPHPQEKHAPRRVRAHLGAGTAVALSASDLISSPYAASNSPEVFGPYRPNTDAVWPVTGLEVCVLLQLLVT